MKVSINSNLTFKVVDNDNILSAARKSKLTLSHSCLNGRCSECKVKVVSGDYIMPKNQLGLSAQEVKQGYCLSCITIPKSDLILEEVNYFEGVLPKVKTIPAKISNIKLLSKEVIKLELRTPPNKNLEFIAGQYIDLSYKNIKRSYSISSVPSNNFIHLIIKKYKNGEFSNYLFNEAKVNDLLRIEGPKGTYILTKKIKKKIIFLSTGTGIAPNISIIRDALINNKITPKQITIIHGQRYINEHVYSLEEMFQDIKVIKTISREKIDGYFKGYVQDALINLNIDMNNTFVFACGNIDMISDVKSILTLKGFNNKNFKSDVFVPSN